MSLTVNIATGNAAFTENMEYEITRILSEIPYAIERGDREGMIRDSNGNTVGGWQLKDAD